MSVKADTFEGVKTLKITSLSGSVKEYQISFEVEEIPVEPEVPGILFEDDFSLDIVGALPSKCKIDSTSDNAWTQIIETIKGESQIQAMHLFDKSAATTTASTSFEPQTKNAIMEWDMKNDDISTSKRFFRIILHNGPAVDGEKVGSQLGFLNNHNRADTLIFGSGGTYTSDTTITNVKISND